MTFKLGDRDTHVSCFEEPERIETGSQATTFRTYVVFTEALALHCDVTRLWKFVPFVCGECKAPVHILKAKMEEELRTPSAIFNLLEHPDQAIQALAKEIDMCRPVTRLRPGDPVGVRTAEDHQREKRLKSAREELFSLARGYLARKLTTWEGEYANKLCDWYESESSRRCCSCRREKLASAGVRQDSSADVIETGVDVSNGDQSLHRDLESAVTGLKEELIRTREAEVHALQDQIALLREARAADGAALQQLRQGQELMARRFAELEETAALNASLHHNRSSGFWSCFSWVRPADAARSSQGSLYTNV